MMKRTVAVLLSVAMLTVGCGTTVNQEDYDAMEKSNKTLQEQLDETKATLDSTNEKLETASADYDALKTEYDEYKESMKPYEEMEAAEAEKKTAEAKAQAAEKEAEDKANAAVKKIWNFEQGTLASGATRELYNDALTKVSALTNETTKTALMEAVNAADATMTAQEQAAAAEEAQGYETGITYDQLARTPDDYMLKKVKFHGKVIQVIEGDDTIQIRLAVNDDYDTILFAEYNSSIVSSRVLEDDEITIYGISVGTISYQSTMGGTITIPGVTIDKIDQ